MATQITMWKCNDGFLAYSEAEALAYEVKVAIEMLSKKYSGVIKVNQFGQVDVDSATQITDAIVADLQSRADAVKTAVAALPVAAPVAVAVDPVPVTL